jgi:hypothetical protein
MNFPERKQKDKTKNKGRKELKTPIFTVGKTWNFPKKFSLEIFVFLYLVDSTSRMKF